MFLTQSNFITSIDLPLCFEAQLLIEFNIFVLTKQGYFIALLLPSFILQSKYDDLAQAFPTHLFAGHNILDFPNPSMEDCRGYNDASKSDNFLIFAIDAHNVYVLV